MEKCIKIPIKTEELVQLQAGDFVLLSGTIYTARDAAHKRMYHSIMGEGELPFPLSNNIIYYMGPTPKKTGNIIGSAGPTTSSRMDKYTPLFIKNGLQGMIGKGKRSEEVKKEIIENNAIYFLAIGGIGALLSKSIKKSEIIAYEDLGTEAVRKLEIEDFPVIVGIDTKGNDIYDRESHKNL